MKVKDGSHAVVDCKWLEANDIRYGVLFLPPNGSKGPSWPLRGNDPESPYPRKCLMNRKFKAFIETGEYQQSAEERRINTETRGSDESV